MRFVADALYLLFALIAAPIWLPRMIATGKVRTDWAARFGRVRETILHDDRPRILIHAVSVGEVNATQMLVKCLADDPCRPRIIIATTTDTGFARATAIYGGAHAVIRYPFDLSWSVHRVLDHVRPDVAALVELEVWPNFTAACARRGIAVGVINGRLSQRSFRRYRRVQWLMSASFRRLSFAAVQTQEYAARFEAMGVPAARISVTNTMKWDTARIEDQVAGAGEVAKALGIDRTRPLIVAGSTAASEHRLLHEATPPGVQLLCAPRKPEWFEQAARDLPGCARRSSGSRAQGSDRFLLDTIGELRAAYSLADVAVVGRTFEPLGGSDMMEPISLGKATIIGPEVRNFADTAATLLASDGLVQVEPEALPRTLEELLNDSARREELARNGRDVIRRNQGASALHASIILSHLRD